MFAIYNLYFSAAGKTEEITKALAKKLAIQLKTTVLSQANIRISEKFKSEFKKDDILFVGLPVYNGRIPKSAAKKLQTLKGNGALAIAVSVFGNRAYDDALLELSDLLTEKGFITTAAAAFSAQHSLLPSVGKGRPDKNDFEKMDLFIEAALPNISAGQAVKQKIQGNKPYKGKPDEFRIMVGKGPVFKVAGWIMKLFWGIRKEPEWFV